MQHSTMSSSLFKFHSFLFTLLWNRVNDTNTVKNITETDTETKVNKERQSASGTMNSVVFVSLFFLIALCIFLVKASLFCFLTWIAFLVRIWHWFMKWFFPYPLYTNLIFYLFIGKHYSFMIKFQIIFILLLIIITLELTGASRDEVAPRHLSNV